MTIVPISEKFEIIQWHTKQIQYNVQRCAELPEEKRCDQTFQKQVNEHVMQYSHLLQSKYSSQIDGKIVPAVFKSKKGKNLGLNCDITISTFLCTLFRQVCQEIQVVQANKQTSQSKTHPLNHRSDVSSKYFGKSAHSLLEYSMNQLFLL